MVVPLTPETAWADALATVPDWQPPLVPTVVIAPHPDDESLAAGGVIAWLRERDVPVTVIAVTDGENCYAGESGLAERRIPEQEAAIQRLGVRAEKIHRLHLCDSGVSALESQLTTSLQPLLQRAGHILAPWPYDFHPDHEVTGRAAQIVAEKYGIPLTWYFFWTWHRGTPGLLQELKLVRLPLTPAQMQAKREAILCHASQLQHASGDPILPEDILQPAWRQFEVFLPHASGSA